MNINSTFFAIVHFYFYLVCFFHSYFYFIFVCLICYLITGDVQLSYVNKYKHSYNLRMSWDEVIPSLFCTIIQGGSPSL